MLAKFNETHNIILPYCTPNVGNFALESDSGRITHWDTCREQFASKFNQDLNGFYFSHKEDKGYDIANFLHRFENIIKSCDKNFVLENTEFAFTSSPCVMHVKVSPFWKECYFKRSLFTIIIRCGSNYDNQSNNFDECLFNPDFKECVYLLETKLAVMRFLFGYTKYTGTQPVPNGSSVLKHGWKEEFKNEDCHSIRQKLILPENLAGSTNIVGLDSIWA